jgi:hypothetical protein
VEAKKTGFSIAVRRIGMAIFFLKLAYLEN